MHRRYYDVMPSITIRHVPDEVRNELASRAARKGQSLQEFLLAEVSRLALKPQVEDLMTLVRDRKAGHAPVGRDQILADRDADRR